jgi:hypothetical protein
MGEVGVWGPYNQGKSWKEKIYPRGKEVRKYFHNLKIQARRHIAEESSGRTRGENR